MKKLLSLILLVACVALPMAARDKVTRDVNVLPAAARTLINTHFGKTGVNHIKIDKKTFGGVEYDVILNNGTEIDFDSKGQWKEIDCGADAVPSALILKSISDYVAKNYKGQKIVKIEVDRSKYEVELLNGTDLEFDRSGKFLRVDR